MPIEVRCGSCGATLRAPDNAGGKKVKCPRCQTPMLVPVPVAEDEPVEMLEFAEPAAAEPASRRAAARAPAEPATFTGDPATRLPRDLLEQVMAELTQGEKLVWACQPSARVMKLRGVGAVFFGCVFASVGLLGAAGFSRGTGGILPVLIGLSFAGIGSLLGIAGGLFAHKQARRTIYALTNKRAIVWQSAMFSSPKIESFNAFDVMGVKRQDSWWIKGAGDVIFRQEKTIVVSTSRHHGPSTSEHIQNFGFLSVEAAREVEKLVRETLHVRTRPDEEFPVPNPAAVVQAQDAVAGQSAGIGVPLGYAAAAGVLGLALVVAVVMVVSAPAQPKAPNQPGQPNPDPAKPPKKITPGSPEDWAEITAAIPGDDANKRANAVERVIQMKPDPKYQKEIAKSLAGLLGIPGTRDRASLALVTWATPAEVPALIDALKSDSGWLRTQSLDALARLKDPAAAEAVAGVVITGDREKAKNTLIAIGPPAEAAVRPLLQETNPDIQITAARILAKIGTAASVADLTKLAADTKTKNRAVSKEAEDAAKEIGKRKK